MQALETLRWGGRRSAPYAFTEQGVAMLSSVLSSPQAIAVNIEVMRAFVRLREVLAGNKELATKLGELERKLKGHDQAIAGILSQLRIVFRDKPVRFAISCSNSLSRKCIRRILPNISMVITRFSPA